MVWWRRNGDSTPIPRFRASGAQRRTSSSYSQAPRWRWHGRFSQPSRFRIQATDLLSGNQYFADFTLDGRSDPNHPVRRVFGECGLTIGESYEGEAFCRDTAAWPNGTYLGQMHPFHANFYKGFAERRGWEPCETWATDQRNSAIRGLRALGYTVTGNPP